MSNRITQCCGTKRIWHSASWLLVITLFYSERKGKDIHKRHYRADNLYVKIRASDYQAMCIPVFSNLGKSEDIKIFFNKIYIIIEVIRLSFSTWQENMAFFKKISYLKY